MGQLATTQGNLTEKERWQFKNRVLKETGEDCGRILIVEDESALQEILEFNLVRQGFDVLLADDGLEACRIIGREKPDLILLDLLLPTINGWEICRMVRAQHDPALAGTPIIMLSALGSADDRLKGYGQGADLYLPKPYNIKEVVLKSRQLIAQHHDRLNLLEKLAALQQWTDLQDRWQHALFHELRNQLTVISGMAQHLRDEKQLSTECSEQFVEQISSSTDYLGSLAENYLLVRQVEELPGQLAGEPVILLDLLAELQTIFDPLATRKNCNLQISCPATLLLQLHPIGLKIIISNLLDNALKFSAADGHVSLTVTESAEQVQIRIQDDGPGIGVEERAQVFDKFFRGRSGQQKTCGSGLGLYMARILAQSMDGSLELRDNLQPGCCFELSFLRHS